MDNFLIEFLELELELIPQPLFATIPINHSFGYHHGSPLFSVGFVVFTSALHDALACSRVVWELFVGPWSLVQLSWFVLVVREGCGAA